MKTSLDLSRQPAGAAPAPKSLAGMSLPALKAEMEGLGLDPKKAGMRAKQLRRWMHYFGVQDFEAMTDIGKDLRARLADTYTAGRPEITDHQSAATARRNGCPDSGRILKAKASIFRTSARQARSAYRAKSVVR